MKEDNRTTEAAAPYAEEMTEPENNKATIPLPQDEVTIPIKFNKEIKNLTVAEAANLAQKGMKYDLICCDYEKLKDLSRKNGKSVTEYLEALKADNYNKRMQELTEKCGGDRALAEHIINLESDNANESENGFGELQKSFPCFKKADDLPEEILEAARLKGTLLLDEYLRYRLAQQRRSEEIIKTQKLSENASVGSQINRMGRVSPEASEFLKGLWK